MDRKHIASLLASSFSRILPPALVLVVLLMLAGVKAGLSPLGIILLVVGVIGIPGLIYRWTKGLFSRLGIPDHLRVNMLLVFTFTASVVCFVIPVAPPVPWTVAALFVGNAGLVFFRRWLNVSAHVSVMTFGVLWCSAAFGGSWAWLLVLSPMMLFSRVAAREHSLKEALAGLALGIATFCCFLGAMTWS